MDTESQPILGVGINGFGRIGRLVVRAIENNEHARVVAINVSQHPRKHIICGHHGFE